ncbi:deoxyuridine triphosphatase [Microbacterium phage Theresita]|nr:deoxyuridine triphosphatase [Microbacterium phage Theresita]
MAGARKMKIAVTLDDYAEQLDLGDELMGEARMPIRAHSDDAGWDLFVSQTVVVPPHGFMDVPSGVSIQLPNGYWGMLTGRSSTIRKRGLLVVQGIIDTGYTGELFSAVWNLTDEEITLKRGERVAQLIILPNATAQTVMVQAERLGETERGWAGFGSSGV